MVKESILENLPIWKLLTDGQKEQVRSHSSEIEYKKGTMIYSHDVSCLGMIYVISGGFGVVAVSDEGRELTLFHISKDEYCIFSAGCVLGQINMETEMIADDDSHILAVDPKIYKRLILENSKVKEFTDEMIIRKMSTVIQKMQEILFQRVDGRLARYLLLESKTNNSEYVCSTQENIAKELNTAREVVARILKRFAHEGLIEIGRGRITVTDPEGLSRI